MKTMLEAGYNTSFEIRRESCVHPAGEKFTLLFLSDLHFTRFSKNTARKISATVRELNPDIVLLGGDYADSPKGLLLLNSLLQELSQRKNIFAIAGNHDYFFGIEAVRKVMEDNNVMWLEKKSFRLFHANQNIRISGNVAEEGKSEADFSILLLHKPIDLRPYQDLYHLALAGHLHGGQIVLHEKNGALYPGRFFYSWNILKKQMGSCLYLISKGLGDTLPLRFNCKRDLIFITVE